MADDYVTIAELKATLELSDEQFPDPDLARAITAASRGLDKLTGRRFWADDDADQVRYYSPRDTRELRVDDIVTLTTLETDPGGDGTFEETWTVNTDFVLEPINAAADGEPWNRLCVHPNSSRYFPAGYPRSVKITAKFGWAAVPDVVKEATGIVAAKLMRRAREAPFGIVAIGLDSGIAMRVARSDPDVMFLVGDLIRDRVAVA